MPLTICRSVLLPHPLGPTRLRISPFSTEKETSLSAPEIGVTRLGTGKQFAQAVAGAAVQAIELGDVLDLDQILG